MKKTLFLLILLSLVTIAYGQENRNFRIPLIGETAPSFVAESTNGTINFPLDFGRKWKILFSHPQDFTPVCSSELLELANLQMEFDKINTKLVVISTDQLETHEQWVKAMEEVKYKNREPVKIKFPLVDDFSKNVAKKYGMIHSATNNTKDVRGVFIIDPNDIIQAIYFYPMGVGRSTVELIRTVNALQASASGEHAIPADWQKGDDVLVPVPPRIIADNPNNLPPDYYRVTWFMLFKRTKPSSTSNN